VATVAISLANIANSETIEYVPKTSVFGTIFPSAVQHPHTGGVFVSKPNTEINVSHLEQEVWFWYS
jgi:hypothetical protein